MNTLAMTASDRSQARAIVRAVKWKKVVFGFVAAFVTGVLFAFGLKALGWWPGASWERVALHAAQRFVSPGLDVIMLTLPLFGTNYSVAPVVAVAVVLLWRKRQYAIALHMAVVQAGSWALN